MKLLVTGAVLALGLALAGPAHAAPGQCSLTGYDTFDCDVTADGGGITFALPDGKTFVFAHVANGSGIGYLIAPDQAPGRSPGQLGTFDPVEGEEGCWADPARDLKFCAAISQ